jgi:hypothetical protein
MSSSVDTFVEVMLGKDQSRFSSLNHRIELIEESNTKDLKGRIYEYREFLTDMDTYLNEKKDSDLLSIRDDILVEINQFLYLLTLNK